MCPMRIALLALILLNAIPARPAAECRSMLRPLLRDQAPLAAEVERARNLCQAQAEAGDADATYHLALTYLGLGGRWEPDSAIPLIQLAAERGVAEAQYWLAWQHESGLLLPHDTSRALGWYLRAAQAQHRLALARLARAHEFGELGLPIEPRRAGEYRARQAHCARDASMQGVPPRRVQPQSP